jgi:hypothetical protein
MNKWKIILGVSLLLLLGVVIGSILTNFYFKRWFLTITISPRARTEYVMNKISKDLNLSPAQKMKIGEIIKESEQDLLKVKYRERERVMERIKMELNNDQQKQLESRIEKFLKWRQKVEARYLH